MWTTGSCIYTLDEAKQAIDEMARQKKEGLQMTPGKDDKESDQQSTLITEIKEPNVTQTSTARKYHPSATITKEEQATVFIPTEDKDKKPSKKHISFKDPM